MTRLFFCLFAVMALGTAGSAFAQHQAALIEQGHLQSLKKRA